MRLKTMTEAAKLLGVSRRRLKAGIDDGRYPSLRFGSRIMVDVDVLRPIIFKENRAEAQAQGRMMGLRACAKEIGVSEWTLKAMAETGLVPCRKKGRYWMFDPDAVKRAIRTNME